MDRSELYDKMAERKIKPKDFEPYTGGNGRIDKCVSLIRQGDLRSGGTLLDVGGAIGDLGYAVRDLFEERWLVDISWENCRAASSKGNIAQKVDVDKDALPFVADSADLICALDFIEHIVDPENFARECFRLLKSSGEVFINTPNIQFYEHIQTLIHTGYFPHTSGDKDVFHGGHLAFYTYNDLRLIFDVAGFTCAEQIMDTEGYKNPPEFWVNMYRPRNQEHYKQICMRLGCPNLLFKAIKP